MSIDDGPITFDVATLRDAVATGALAGSIVVVNGRVASEGCEPETGCEYSIVGLPGQPVVLAPDLFGRMSVASPFDDQAVRPYAFRVRDDGAFVVLGVVGAGSCSPESVGALAAMAAPSGQLVRVAGWLSRWQADGAAAPIYALRGSRPPADPSSDQPAGLEVAVAPDARLDRRARRRLDVPGRTDGRWVARRGPIRGDRDAAGAPSGGIRRPVDSPDEGVAGRIGRGPGAGPRAQGRRGRAVPRRAPAVGRAARARPARSMPNGVPMAWMVGSYHHLPLWVAEGKGAHFTDVDGHTYRDFNIADLSMFCGYAPEPLVRAVSERMARGNQFLLPTEDAIVVSEELRPPVSACRSGSTRARRPTRTPRRSASPASRPAATRS